MLTAVSPSDHTYTALPTPTLATHPTPFSSSQLRHWQQPGHRPEATVPSATAKLLISLWGKMWSLCWTACCCWNTATRTTPTKLLTGCPQPCTDITKYSQYSRWWKMQTEKIQKLCTVQSHKHYPQNVITSTIQYGILLLKIDPVLFFVLSFFPQIRGTW